MTLEQIKHRQERINEQLYTLLNNTQGVMDTIIGEQPTSEEKGIDRGAPSGLLQEIDRQQDITQTYLQKLEEYNRQLISYTYTPSEAVCQAKANY